VRFTIRNYRPEDFATLLRIDQFCFAPGIAYSAFELKSYIQRRTAFTFVAEGTAPAELSKPAELPEGASIVGFLVGERTRAIGHIITIDVVREARRHKVGSALLELAEEHLRLWNCAFVRLETAVDNISALSFYKRHGYHVIQTIPRYYSTGVDALLLEKDLLSPPPSS
jgi:ribosomal protein S18 acetylase RimI-like enzyme